MRASWLGQCFGGQSFGGQYFGTKCFGGQFSAGQSFGGKGFRAALVAGAVFAASLTAGLQPAWADAPRVVIILDGSGSMWGRVGERTKIEIAKETLTGIIQTLPENTSAGLMSYGHREKGVCADIEVMVPPGPGTADAMITALNSISPKGKTPLTDAVRMAAESLRFTEEQATVVLVTDGLETCERDPCALARELESAGIGFTTHVIGFGLNEEEGQQVACLAEETGGLYLAAGNAEDLTDALTQTVVAAPEPEPEPAPQPEPVAPEFNLVATAVLSESAPELTDKDDIRWDVYPAGEDGTKGKVIETNYQTVYRKNLDPGRYVVSVRYGMATVETVVEVSAEEVSEPVLDLDAGKLVLNAFREEGADAIGSDARFDVTDKNKKTATNYGSGRTWVVPAGETIIKARAGKAEVTETIQISAGETLEKDLILASGLVRPRAYYSEGGPHVERDVRFDIFGVTKSIDGRRENFGTNYGDRAAFELPAGDYVVMAKTGTAVVEVPVTVEANALAEPDIVMNAGVLAITAPNGDRIDVMEAKADINGRHKDVATNYGEAWQVTLGAGDYIVKVRRKDQSVVEAEVSVPAGERTEITVGG